MKKMHQLKSKAAVVTLLIFICVCSLLGEKLKLYDKLWWWDIMLHFVSGVTFAIVGFILAKKLGKGTAPPIFIALFALTFAVTAGVMWEIFEFVADSLRGSNMQRWIAGTDSAAELGFGGNRLAWGLTDTMKDLIVGTVAALLSAAIIYFGQKKKWLTKPSL